MATTQFARAQDMFPPSIRDTVWWSSLIDDEPRLWCPGALKGFETRIRLSISGNFRISLLVRIDEGTGGRGTGRFALVRRTGASPDLLPIRNYSFRVSSAKMRALHARLKAADLWTAGPEEHWALESDANPKSDGSGDVCIDGEQMVFERVDKEGYRFSEANAQCTASPRLLAAARQIIVSSGDPGVRKVFEMFGLNE